MTSVTTTGASSGRQVIAIPTSWVAGNDYEVCAAVERDRISHCRPFAVTSAGGRQLHVLSPNGGERLEIGVRYPIRWSSSGVAEARVEVVTGSRTTLIRERATESERDGTLGFTPLPEHAALVGSIRVSAADDPTVNDQSDAPFAIASTTAVTPPLPPSLEAPANDATTSSGPVGFRWGDAVGAARFQLLVCRDVALRVGCVNPDGGDPGLEPSVGSRTVTASLDAGVWYWAVRGVRAGDVGGWGAYSAVRSLSVTGVAPPSPPSSPALSSPSDGASMTSGSINFVWGTSTNADRYHLMVCTNSALTSGCVNPDGGQVGVEPSSGVTSTSVSLSAGTWYWAVRAIPRQATSGLGRLQRRAIAVADGGADPALSAVARARRPTARR
nr:hypothetical protein [Deltaproteobacteria bacterium]